MKSVISLLALALTATASQLEDRQTPPMDIVTFRMINSMKGNMITVPVKIGASKPVNPPFSPELTEVTEISISSRNPHFTCDVFFDGVKQSWVLSDSVTDKHLVPPMPLTSLSMKCV